MRAMAAILCVVGCGDFVPEQPLAKEDVMVRAKGMMPVVATCMALGCGTDAMGLGAASPDAGASADGGTSKGEAPRLMAADAGGGVEGGRADTGAMAGDVGTTSDVKGGGSDVKGGGPVGDWLIFNARSQPSGCTCGTDGQWSCISQAARDHWNMALGGFCGGKNEGDPCSGVVPAVKTGDPMTSVPAFVVEAGTCRTFRCCPGCWDGTRCRVTFKQWPSWPPQGVELERTRHRVMDWRYPTGQDFTYFCGSGGQACTSGKGEVGNAICMHGTPVTPTDACPSDLR